MRKNDDSMLNIALDGLSLMHSQNIKHILIYILMDNGYKREFRAKVIMLLASYRDKSVLEFLLKNRDARESLLPESLKAMINFNDTRMCLYPLFPLRLLLLFYTSILIVMEMLLLLRCLFFL